MWKDSETNIDYLGFKYILDTLNQIILNSTLMPSSIGVYGYWGSGKSSLMEMSYNSISQNEDTLCVKFNGWKFEGYDDAKTALMGVIMDSLHNYIVATKTLKDEVKDTLLQKTKDIFTRIDKLRVAKAIGSLVVGAINPIMIPVIGAVGKVIEQGKTFIKEDTENYENEGFTSTRREIDSFQTDFNELVKQSGLNRIVVYIDELDRCNCETILSTLEAIRLFLFINTTVFVIGADERHVKNAVIYKFGTDQKNNISIGKEYLEKMIQYPIRIPTLDINSMEIYVLLLFLSRDLNSKDFDSVFDYVTKERNKNILEFTVEEEELRKRIKNKINISEVLSISKNLAYILTSNLDGNPRQVKRFLNTLEIRKQYAKSVNVDLNDSIMLKLMILEYFRPKIYSFLQDQYEGSVNDLQNELSKVEEVGIQDSQMFSMYKEDDWLIYWFKLKPQINGVELGSYFYFSREGMSAIKSIGDIVPPIVESVLKNVSAGGQANIRIAFESLNELTDLESSILIQEVVKMESRNQSISLPSFRLLNEIIIQKPNKYNECKPIFRIINGDDIKPSFAFVIKNTINKIKPSLKEDFLIICSKWEEENKKISIIEKGE